MLIERHPRGQAGSRLLPVKAELMSSWTALVLFAVGIAGLFYLDREPGARVSKGLYLPTIWLLLAGSRPVSTWLGATGPMRMAGAQYQRAITEGNPQDAAVLGFLLILALIVVWRRRRQAAGVLRWMWPVVAYFGYCVLSVGWSNIPDVAGKRWVKSLGDLAMVLVVATEPDMAAALRRVASRAGILLLPTSYLAIKYFPRIGRGFDVDGNPSNIGLTTNKNLLGAVAFLLSMAALWQFLCLLGSQRPDRRRRATAQAVIFFFGAYLLQTAHSATSVAAGLFGAALLLAFSLPRLRRPAAVHGLVALVFACGLLAFMFGAEASVTHGLGRQTDLTGRTFIWKAVLAQAAEHPLFGVGFESFWTGRNDSMVLQRMPTGMIANESHDGYIEVYAELGLVGLALIIWLLTTAYRRAASAMARDWRLGRILVALVAALAIYNITEAGFRMLDPVWIFLLLCFACAARTLADQTPADSDGGHAGGTPAGLGPPASIATIGGGEGASISGAPRYLLAWGVRGAV